MLKDLLLFLARSLVDNPDKVNVTENDNGQSVIFKLSVADEDMGKVIGKQGRNAQAIRLIMKAAASKENKKVIVDVE